MKALVAEQNLESSVKDCFGECKQIMNSLIFNPHLTKKFMAETSFVSRGSNSLIFGVA